MFMNLQLMDITDMTDDQIKTELVSRHLGATCNTQVKIEATREELEAALTHARQSQAA